MGGCFENNEAEPMELKQNGDGDSEPPGKYGRGKKFDPSFNGPIKNRSCTDCICCILFFFMIIAMLIVGFLGFSWGNPKRLLYPTDSHGNSCGQGEFADKKNLFFFDLLECIPKDLTSMWKISSCPTQQICVKECPSKNILGSSPKTAKADLYCKYSAQKRINTTSMSNQELVNSGDCAKYTLKSQALAFRCVPTVAGEALISFLKEHGGEVKTNGRNLTEGNIRNATIAQTILLNAQNVGQRVLGDVRTSWHWILAGFGICLVASFIYILIMRWVAGIFVWLTTYAVLTLLGFAAYYCYTEYKRLAEVDKSDIGFEFITNLSSYKEKKETWLVLGIIASVLLAVLLLLLLALRKRIVIAIQLIKEGSRCITSMLSTLFFPFFPWFLQLILFSWFVLVLAFLSTSGTGEYRQVLNGTITSAICKATEAINDYVDENKSISCNFQKYNTDENVLRLQVFHLFGWFWIMNFIIALGQCVLAGAFASWYWAWDKKKDVPALPLISSLGRTLRYHTGSLAFGSLIIAMIQLIRVALEYIEYKLTSGRDPGSVIKFLLKCLKCCFWCLEKFMKFLNKNAYIEIAVYGKNFCTSAKNAFFLLMRNILRVAVLDKVTDFILFIGKLTITIVMGVASFYFFRKNEDLNYYLTPVIIITISAWVVASAFFGVYEMAINTVFLCFLEDSERHDGSEQKPFYMSKKLRKILGKKNKVTEDDE